jgi:surface antigen
MVVGKLLILAATSSSAFANNDINNPRFFEYRGGSFINELITVSFGWFKTLSTDQKDAYTQAVTHAVMYAENGKEVVWYKGDASGVAVPVMTWPNGSGYCRRIHVQVIAYNTEKIMSQTACYSNASTNWQWIRE